MIRHEQLVVLRASVQAEFLRRLLAHVREAWAAAIEGQNDEVLLTVLREAVARANGFGLETERDVAAYVDVMYALGGPPEDQAWAAEVLRDTSLPAAHRAYLLHAEAVKRLDRGDV